MSFLGKERILWATLVFLFVSLLYCMEALAHGTLWRQEHDSLLLAFFLEYDDGTPMAFAKVKIFSPNESAIEFQTGNADRNGFFCFRPDLNGVWSFEATDGQGHLAKGQIEGLISKSEKMVGNNVSQVAQLQPNASDCVNRHSTLKVILGLSLILNLTLLSYFVVKRKISIT
ncbi:MAG: hypothetical protein LBV23_03905 [Deltaproteobacteria bacterium]|jgi:nickel transport protein|nr:hypothetical protein [Deltaproteobacteria bacterium]